MTNDKFIPGQIVTVTIHKNGYWHNALRARFVGYTKSGLCQVKRYDWGKARNFQPCNVQAAPEKFSRPC